MSTPRAQKGLNPLPGVLFVALPLVKPDFDLRALLSLSLLNLPTVGTDLETAHLPPAPKPKFCPKWKVSVNVGLGEGWVGSFPETYNDPFCLQLYKMRLELLRVGRKF